MKTEFKEKLQGFWDDACGPILFVGIFAIAIMFGFGMAFNSWIPVIPLLLLVVGGLILTFHEAYKQIKKAFDDNFKD